MSQFAWVDDISEEDAEALVFATGITDLETLAKANADEILKRVELALRNGDVRVPAGYMFTLDKVKSWISAAKKYS